MVFVHLLIKKIIKIQYKLSEWELKGVAVRLEIRPKDMEGDTAMAARRDERDNKGRSEKVSLKWKNIEKIFSSY